MHPICFILSWPNSNNHRHHLNPYILTSKRWLNFDEFSSTNIYPTILWQKIPQVNLPTYLQSWFSKKLSSNSDQFGQKCNLTIFLYLVPQIDKKYTHLRNFNIEFVYSPKWPKEKCEKRIPINRLLRLRVRRTD